MNNSEDNFMRLEKKATNKVGLIILFIIVIGLLGVGGYFVYQNKDNISFDFTMPWQKKDEEKKDDKTTTTKTDDKTIIKRQNIKISSKQIYKRNNLTIDPDSITYDEKDGYTVKLKALYSSANNLSISISHITVDGYQLENSADNISLVGNVSSNITVNIPVSFLDLYNLEEFSQVVLYGKVNQNSQNTTTNNDIKFVINTDKTTENTTSLANLEPINTNSDVKIYYYQIVSSKDENKIQILIDNQNDSINYDFKINQLKINNTKYEDVSFNETVNYNSKKFVYITIPTKKIKKIEEFEVSFFILDQDNLNITKANNIKIKK